MSITDVPRCGARTRWGGLCQQPAMRPSGRCRLHGGKSPRGMASPNFKNGRYSRDLPVNLARRVEDLYLDRDLLSLRDEITLITATIGEKVAELETAGQSVNWDEVNKRVQAALANGRGWDWTKVEQEWKAVGELLVQRRDKAVIMKEIRSLIDQRARLVAVESKRLQEMKATMTLEEAIILAQRLTGIVRKHVPDSAVLERIGREWAQVIELSPDAIEVVSAEQS